MLKNRIFFFGKSIHKKLVHCVYWKWLYMQIVKMPSGSNSLSCCTIYLIMFWTSMHSAKSSYKQRNLIL
jgi:hypothetical protein